jgi:MacB-like periplasmic core domain
MIGTFTADVRSAIRHLLKNPLFNAAAVLPMALGIGVSTTMFTVGDALLRKPLSIPGLERLVAIVETSLDRKTATSPATSADYADIERQNRSFEWIAAYRYENRTLNRGDASVSVVAAEVSSNFFTGLGAFPQMGRTFTGPMNQYANALVVSYAFWRNRLGADPSAIGHNIELDSQNYTVVGVMPKGFSFPLGAEVWRLLAVDVKAANDHTQHQIHLAAKLRPGITLPAANTELVAIADRLAASYPNTNKGWGIQAIPLSELITGRMTGQYVVFLLGAVLLVLTMACSNVANLLLARGATRQNELAVR